MQVNGKILLDSAENILKNRHQEAKPEGNSRDQGEDRASVQKSKPNSPQTSLNGARILKLEAELKSAQERYTREQVRESFLLNKPQAISEKLEYEGSPLFPEYKAGLDTKNLAKNVSYKLKQLLHSMKSIQVEMENLYALNFKALSPEEANIRQMDLSFALKGLDPKRVLQLTKS